MLSAESGATPVNEDQPRENLADHPARAEGARLVRNRSVRRALLSIIRPIFNPLVLLLAGGKRATMMSVIHHQGRRSGRAYATPVSARRTPDGFMVPLTFGEQADWFRNVKAAGGCVIEWNDTRYPVVDPRIVDWSVARSAFSPAEQKAMRLMGMENFVQLRRATSSRLRALEIQSRHPAGRRAVIWVFDAGQLPSLLAQLAQQESERLDHAGATLCPPGNRRFW